MIVYVTRPDNHELVMGGWRSVRMWTERPSFAHTPRGGYFPPIGGNEKATFQDLGWNVDQEKACTKFKPLTKQDQELELNAWNLMAWSACPRHVSFENWEQWAELKENEPGQFGYSNWSNLMWHRNTDSDLASNVHYKRFLMEVNLRTNKCRLLVPKVHIYYPEESRRRAVLTDEVLETQDITLELATRTYYECPELDDDIPF